MTARKSIFAQWLAQQEWREPEAIIARYRESMALQAKIVGASVDGVDILIDGQRHYLPSIKGEDDSRQYYVASIEKHSDGTLWPEITFGSFKASVENRYWEPRKNAWDEFESARSSGKPITSDNDAMQDYRRAVAEQAKRAEALRRAREALFAEAAQAVREACEALMAAAVRPLNPGETHPYLAAKGILPSSGVRIATQDFKARVYSRRYMEWRDNAVIVRAGDLIIPMYEAVDGGQLWAVQRITRDGDKLYLPGARKIGLYHRIEGSTDIYNVCEGYATGLSVNAALGATTLVAFDADNLEDVVNFARGEARGRPVVVAADNDWETAKKPQMNGRNPGIDIARDIERRYSVPFIAPKFTDDATGCSDWDDQRQRLGFEAMQANMRSALSLALRQWSGMPTNDASLLPVHRLEAVSAAPAPAQSQVPTAQHSNPASEAQQHQAQQADVAVIDERIPEPQRDNEPLPQHWATRDISEILYPEVFPHANDKRTAPLDTRENLQHMMELYGITCRYNQISKDHDILIPGMRFSRDNRANAVMAELISLCKRNKMPTQNIDQYVVSIADRKAYNPVAQWITSKPWDGRNRIRAFLDTLTVADGFDASLRDLLLSKWMLSAIAAAMKPNGFYSKGVLVLRGVQSRGKTSWFKRLVSGPISEYIKDGVHLDPTNKDLVFTAMAHWLIELGELDATFRKADIAILKSFIPKAEDRLRRPFERKDSMLPRRTVFFASVNDKQFLVDDTGNTRWWTVEVSDVDYEHDIDMQQVWAQFYEQHYLRGAQWWLTPAEENMLNASNANFEIVDPIEERIISAFSFEIQYDPDGNRKYVWDGRVKMQATDILIAMGYDKPDRKQTITVGRVLNRMGLAPKRSNRGSMYDMPNMRLKPAGNDNYKGNPY